MTRSTRPVASAARAIKALEKALDDVAEYATPDLADALATLQDLKYRLGQAEAVLSSALGKREGAIQGNLKDGRQFTLKRAADRKEWNHDDWKRDVRRNVTAMALEGLPTTDGTLQVIHDATGEVVEVRIGRTIQEALAAAQEVHGAQSPKSTALKALGLWASDYCTSSPAGWRFQAIRPTTKEN